MPKYSLKSVSKLETCDERIQKVFYEVIRSFDCTILYGHRTPQEQFNLFKQGRTFVENFSQDETLKDGIWEVINPSLVVTNCDGYEKLSDHNKYPSKAIDVVPYPINWSDINRVCYFAGHVMMCAKMMGINFGWGGDWNDNTILSDQTLYDYYHFYVKEEK